MKRNRLFDELFAKVPEETKRIVEKQMSCKWLKNGEECGKGLPGTPCIVKGCVAWEHRETKGVLKEFINQMTPESLEKTRKWMDREIMKEELLKLGWVDKGDVLVRYSNPRLGWKEDGTLIVGYYEWKEKVRTMEELKAILSSICTK